jgi:hypothetical protein
MISRLIAFLCFVVLLFIILSQVDLSPDMLVRKNIPDFVLENSYTRHYVAGEQKFTIQAKRIEIFDRRLEIRDAVVRFQPGTEVFSDEMSVDLAKGTLMASQNVMVRANQFQYFGTRVFYDIKQKRFTGYNRGKLLLGSKE